MRRFLTWLTLLVTTLACSLSFGQTPLASPTPFLPLTSSPTDSPPAASPSQPPAPTEAPTPSAAPSPTGAVVDLPDPARVRWAPVVTGLLSPVDLQHGGDGRLFIVEQRGSIRIIQDGNLLPDPFLDIQEKVISSGNEQGLLGLAFHPKYTSNGLFFVNYTGKGGDTFVARYQVTTNPQLADPSTETILLRIGQPFPNHNGGGMAFGPDGYLYIGSGDGGAAGDPFNNGQSLDTLLGKLLRLDVDRGDPYGIPPNNPFAPGGGLPEIWAYGLRNPWRFTFDPLTGDLYIGDVGQGDWEEIDFLSAGGTGGANFGWDLREGLHPHSGGTAEGLIDPVAEYGHDLGCSVTGGAVVRSPSLPEWQGVYLYGDYCSGRIWGLLRGPDGAWQDRVLFETDFRITSFGEDSRSEVYVLDRGGTIYRLEPAD